MTTHQKIIHPIDSTCTWCERHWEPYREGQGYGMAATLLVVQAVLTSPEFMRRCGWDSGTDQQLDTEQINAQLAQLGPLCCWLGDKVMASILERSRRPGTGELKLK